MQQNLTIDDTFVNLAYYYIENAIYVTQVLDKTAQDLMLDELLTEKDKKILRRDRDWSQKAVLVLQKAKKDYQSLCKNLEILEKELEVGFRGKMYNVSQAATLDLLSLDMVYLQVTEQNADAEQKIHEYLKSFDWSASLIKAYDIMRQMVEVHKHIDKV